MEYVKWTIQIVIDSREIPFWIRIQMAYQIIGDMIKVPLLFFLWMFYKEVLY